MRKPLTLFLAVAFLLMLGGCVTTGPGGGSVPSVQPSQLNQPVQPSQPAQDILPNTTPEAVVQAYTKALASGDDNSFLACLGIAKPVDGFTIDSIIQTSEEFRQQAALIVFSDFQYEPFTGEVYTAAMDSLKNDWMYHLEGAGNTLCYTYSQVTEIGVISYTANYQNESMTAETRVVKANGQWYIVMF